MKDCDNPLYDMIFAITQHSEYLYKTVRNLKRLSKDEPVDDDEKMIISLSEVDDLCWCSDEDQ